MGQIAPSGHVNPMGFRESIGLMDNGSIRQWVLVQWVKIGTLGRVPMGFVTIDPLRARGIILDTFEIAQTFQESENLYPLGQSPLSQSSFQWKL